MMNSRWFRSKTFRDATKLREQIRRRCRSLHFLEPEAIAALDTAQLELKRAMDQNADDEILRVKKEALETVIRQWMKPDRYSTWRENVEVVLVAMAIALVIRTFFLHPFKIPTGSMQPTLYGIEYEKADTVPNLPGRIWDAAIHGVFYREGISGMLAEIAGDHLLVDRVTYNFRPPKRGEIIVFETKGIDHKDMAQDQFYIKRLVGLSGEKISIGDDLHVRIDGVRLNASTPHFEKIYTIGPYPRESHYFGHVNERVAKRARRPGLAPLFPNERAVLKIPRGHYMVMGDNTLNSSDSRTWGSFPIENIIGRFCFVYWPFSNHGESRFGWSRVY